jgi:hypothetical protein
MGLSLFFVGSCPIFLSSSGISPGGLSNRFHGQEMGVFTIDSAKDDEAIPQQ